MELPRRKLLAIAGVAGLNLLAVGPGSAAEFLPCSSSSLSSLRAQRQCLVQVMLTGGNDGLNTVVPIADPQYARLRPTLALSAQETLALEKGYALHPNLQPVARLWERGQCQIHFGVTTAAGTSHLDAGAAWHASESGSTPSSWVSQELSNTFSPSYALVYGDHLTAVTGGRMIAIPMEQANNVGFVTTVEETVGSRHRREMQTAIVRACAQGPSFVFPETVLGQRLRQVAMMLAAGLTPNAVVIGHDGYDTHAAQRRAHDDLLADLGASLGAFATALQALGRWNDVVVMTGSEFGRSAAENLAGGTDHGAHNTHLLLGGAVAGGLVGRHPVLSNEPALSTSRTGLRALRQAALAGLRSQAFA